MKSRLNPVCEVSLRGLPCLVELTLGLCSKEVLLLSLCRGSCNSRACALEARRFERIRDGSRGVRSLIEWH